MTARRGVREQAIRRVLFITRGGSPEPEDAKRGLWRRIRGRPAPPPELLKGQDGFFRGSLRAAFSVTERPRAFLSEHPRRAGRRFDCLLVSLKCDDAGRGATLEDMACVARIHGVPKVLLDASASAWHLPEDEILDLFDLVFKREHLRDLDRYPISARNRAKLRTTMLACPLVPATAENVRSIDVSQFGHDTPSEATDHDVFFSGKLTWPARRPLWERLAREGFDLFGGLQPRRGEPELPSSLAFEPLTKRDYIDAMRRSKLNLALEGYGEFTRRHLEIWFACAFMLSSPSIREVTLPVEALENVHYACYDDEDDLVDKVRYFLDRDQERARIARAGRQLFLRAYDFAAHGAYIRSCLQRL